MKRLFWYLSISILLIIGLLFGVWRLNRRNWAPVIPGNRISVVASFYPLAYFAQEIGGDLVIVTNLTPLGAEPHDFEPTPRDLVNIANSRLLLLNGVGLEPWAESVVTNFHDKNVMVLEVSTDLANLKLNQAGAAGIDPHVWLDPVLAQTAVQRITQALIQVDPNNQVTYQQNSSRLLARLIDLDQTFQIGLTNCGQKKLVTSHAAFGYLAARYDLSQVALAGLSPDEEPTPQDLAAVVEFVRQNQVGYIFFETLVSPRLAETIAREVGAQTLVLNPLEGLTLAQQQAGEDYFTIQSQNLENLQIALDCVES